METLELLKKFCSTDEYERREFLKRPFDWGTYNGHRVAIATDGLLLCVAKNGCEGVEPLDAGRHYIPKNLASLLLGNPDQKLSIDRLRAALAKTPMKHDNDCPECCGDGQVKFEYYCEADGNTYHKAAACPYCGGLGVVGDDKAPLVYDTDYAITIGGQTFAPKVIKRLLDILHSAELLADWPFCVSTEHKRMKIVTPDYFIVVAGCYCNDKVKQIDY